MNDELNRYGVPAVEGWGDTLGSEPFETYIQNWPQTLSNFPESVIRQWVYRHWRDFQNRWIGWDLPRFRFVEATYTNDEIMAIDHISDWLNTLDFWGDELFTNKMRQSTWLATYMLEHGTSPEPIMVAVNAGGLKHPDRGFPMKSPLQLIEGHMRLAYLRGMIRHKHPLQSQHRVWNVTLPAPS